MLICKVAIALTWIMAFCLMLPELFSTNQFILEGFLTSCSIDYLNKELYSRIYFLSIFFLGFVLPCLLIFLFYLLIIIELNSNFKNERNQKDYRKSKRGREFRNDVSAFKSAVAVFALFLLAWMPYSIVCLYAQFSSDNNPIISPFIATLPAIFAKVSATFNPILYIYTNKECRKCFKRIVLNKHTSLSYRRNSIMLSMNLNN
jgi:hypothetical protein